MIGLPTAPSCAGSSEPKTQAGEREGQTIAVSIGTLTTLAESTDAVLTAGNKLRDGQADTDYAVDLLTRRLEDCLDRYGQARTQGFDRTGEQAPVDSVEDSLTIAASQLSMAAVALAADSYDEGAALDAALDDLMVTNATLRQLTVPTVAQGFQAAVVRSADTPAAVDGLRAATRSTLERVATDGGELCDRVIRALPEVLPAINNTWETIKKALNLEVLGEHCTRLARVALRLVAAALDRLATLIPSGFISTARDRLRMLADRLEEDEPIVAVFASILGISVVERDTVARLTRDGLDKSRLDRATGQLTALGEQYGRYVGIASNVAGALKVLHNFSGLLVPIAPQLAIATASAHVLILIAVVAISLDFLDSGTQFGIVRGVRLTVEEATG